MMVPVWQFVGGGGDSVYKQLQSTKGGDPLGMWKGRDVCCEITAR